MNVGLSFPGLLPRSSEAVKSGTSTSILFRLIPSFLLAQEVDKFGYYTISHHLIHGLSTHTYSRLLSPINEFPIHPQRGLGISGYISMITLDSSYDRPSHLVGVLGIAFINRHTGFSKSGERERCEEGVKGGEVGSSVK